MTLLTQPSVEPTSRYTAPDCQRSLPAAVMSEADDFDLLGAYLAGDERAFRALVERHRRSVHAVCLQYFGDHRDAEDATQEVFLVLARRGATIRGDARLSTWLHRVAINTCHDMARHRARRPGPARYEAPEAADAADRVGLRETELDVQAGLKVLDPLSRTLLILVAIEDRSYAEAAALVGVSVPAAKSRIHRARLRLAEVLAPAA